MKIWESILQARQEITKSKLNTVVTIGNFDGVHLGHQAIMKRMTEEARSHGLVSVVLTFSNHTESLFGETPLLINTPMIRRELLEQQRIDYLLEVGFDNHLAGLEPEIFFETWLKEGLRAKTVIVGYDFRFGVAGRGDYQLLKQLGAECHIKIEQMPPVQVGQITVSSSKIRQFLAEGNIETANQLLGYSFIIMAEVVHGEQRGRMMGFPTANLRLERDYLLPCYGVYLVRLSVDIKSYYGIANVGIKPTFGGQAPLVEVYLFDIEINLYNQQVRVEFLRFIRPENRFAGPEALKNQINEDVRTAKRFLGIEEC